MVGTNLHREILKNFWLGHNPAWLDQMDSNYPRYNIVEGKSGFKLEIAVPGWSKKQLTVIQKDNELRIQGVKDSEGGDNYLHRGLSGKSFDKTFVLNCGILSAPPVSRADIGTSIIFWRSFVVVVGSPPRRRRAAQFDGTFCPR